jgi:hypothetical protein
VTGGGHDQFKSFAADGDMSKLGEDDLMIGMGY